MSTKRAVNDNCPCNSDKKCKKCSCNMHVEFGPQTSEELQWRECTIQRFKYIKEPHCRVCGDTTELVQIQTQNGERVFCDFCYNVQLICKINRFISF